MATDTKKADHSKDAPAKREPTLAERQAHVDSAVKAKKTVEETKAEHDAIETVAKINQNLAKDGSTNRVDVQMRAGEPHYRWGQFVPTRELTPEELDAVENIGEPTKPKVPADEPASRKTA